MRVIHDLSVVIPKYKKFIIERKRSNLAILKTTLQYYLSLRRVFANLSPRREQNFLFPTVQQSRIVSYLKVFIKKTDFKNPFYISYIFSRFKSSRSTNRADCNRRALRLLHPAHKIPPLTRLLPSALFYIPDHPR